MLHRFPRPASALTVLLLLAGFAAAPVHARPLLIATDQETGQLSAIGEGTTQFAGGPGAIFGDGLRCAGGTVAART